MGDPVRVAPSLEPVLNAVLTPREDEAPNRRTLRISALAIVAAFLAAVAAQLLTRLIGLITNVAFYGRWSASFVSAAGNSLGMAVVIVPMVHERVGRLPVVSRANSRRVIGIVLRSDLLEAHERRLHAHHRVERTIDLAATLAWVCPNER